MINLKNIILCSKYNVIAIHSTIGLNDYNDVVYQIYQIRNNY